MSRTVSFRGPLRYVPWPTAFVFGIVAEWIGRPELVLLDAVTDSFCSVSGSQRGRCGRAGVWADPRNCRGRLVHRRVVVSGDLPAPRAARALASLVPSPGSLAHIAARPHCDRGSVRLRGRVSPCRQRLRDHCVCVRSCRPVSASGRRGGACSAPAAAGRSYGGDRHDECVRCGAGSRPASSSTYAPTSPRRMPRP
jgi:hypothetical protein